jgi:hypothetical protein
MLRVLCMVIEIKLIPLMNWLCYDFLLAIICSIELRVKKTAQRLRACGKSGETRTPSWSDR